MGRVQTVGNVRKAGNMRDMSKMTEVDRVREIGGVRAVGRTVGRIAKAGGVACAAVLVAVLVAACGDAPTADRRGYTKAPLEDPGLTVRPEPRTVMDSLGEPVAPVPAPAPVSRPAQPAPASAR